MPHISRRWTFLLSQNDKTVYTESELEGCFPFAPLISGDNSTVLDGNLSNPCHQELTSDDKSRYPYRSDLRYREINKSRTDENLVCQRINQFPKGRYKIQLACEIAIQPVADGSNDKRNQRHRVQPYLKNIRQ